MALGVHNKISLAWGHRRKKEKCSLKFLVLQRPLHFHWMWVFDKEILYYSRKITDVDSTKCLYTIKLINTKKSFYIYLDSFKEPLNHIFPNCFLQCTETDWFSVSILGSILDTCQQRKVVESQSDRLYLN